MLHAQIFVNRSWIGCINALRVSGGVGQLNGYECAVEMSGNKLAGIPPILRDKIVVEHHYDDGALPLFGKVIDSLDPVELRVRQAMDVLEDLGADLSHLQASHILRALRGS